MESNPVNYTRKGASTDNMTQKKISIHPNLWCGRCYRLPLIAKRRIRLLLFTNWR